MAQALAALDSLLADLPTAAPAATNGTPAAAATNGGGAAKPKKQQQQQQQAKAKAKAEPAPAAAAPAAPAAPALDPAQQAELDRKYALVRSVGEECVTDAELRNLLLKKPNFVLYDGFEPSGRMHIAQGIFKAMNVNKCTAAGGTFVFWVADWFALMNDKMGGDLERIKTVGHYLIHVWTAAGMDMTRVQFKWSSDEICKNARPYWTQALDIARKFTVTRRRGRRKPTPRTPAGLADEPLWRDAAAGIAAARVLTPPPPPLACRCRGGAGGAHQEVLPDHGATGGHADGGADPLPDHAVHRHLLPARRHLPAGRRPAQGAHASPCMLAQACACARGASIRACVRMACVAHGVHTSLVRRAVIVASPLAGARRRSIDRPASPRLTLAHACLPPRTRRASLLLATRRDATRRR